MEWIKLYTRKWLWGSGRNMTPDKRGVWVDLLALAAEAKMRDGTLRFDAGQPMSRQWIAGTLMLDPHFLDVCLVAFKADINTDDGQPRITIWEDGTIQITNWDKFQNKPEKTIAREIAIEKAKATNRRKDAVLDRLVELVNRLNKVDKQYQYEVVDGKVVDKATGEVKDIAELEKKISEVEK